jgi:hypothetical protein
VKLAAEINDFIRSRTTDAIIAGFALEAARATFSLKLVEGQTTDSQRPIVDGTGSCAAQSVQT